MKGMAVEQVLLIFVCVVVAIGILIWYWQTYAKGSAVFSQSECQQALILRCNEWKAAAFTDPMHARFFCDNGKPERCGCKTDWPGEKGYREKDLRVDWTDWWNCVAPGCEASYGMKISVQSDCP
jgi:hypothetical protein